MIQVAPSAPKLPAYVENVAGLELRMRALAKRYPEIVQVRDIGDSADKVEGKGGHDILALTVGRAERAGEPTPAVAHVAGLHPSEWANPHLLLEWAERAAAGYGRDPEATRLLDTARVAMVPLANPDIYARSLAERGFHRTNAHDVDLNRNFPGSWAAESPRHGSAPASEPETAAVASFLRSTKPTMLIDWHSFMRANLHTSDPGREQGVRAFADRIGMINGYRPLRDADLYAARGTLRDFATFELGVPALTIETGRSFAQSGQEFRSTLADNLPVIDYTAAIAADPSRMVYAPALDVDVATDGAVKAVATYPDGWLSYPAFNGVEVVIDPDAKPGAGVPLTVSGPRDAAMAVFRGTLPTDGLRDAKDGMVWIRSQVNKAWGPLQPVPLPFGEPESR